MAVKKVASFNKKTFIIITILVSFLSLISMVQLVAMFLTSSTFSINLIPLKEISPWILKTMAVLIIVINMTVFITLEIRSFFWRRTRMIYVNKTTVWLFAFLMMAINLLIPSNIPLNYLMPVAYLFCATIVTVVF